VQKGRHYNVERRETATAKDRLNEVVPTRGKDNFRKGDREGYRGGCGEFGNVFELKETGGTTWKPRYKMENYRKALAIFLNRLRKNPTMSARARKSVDHYLKKKAKQGVSRGLCWANQKGQN